MVRAVAYRVGLEPTNVDTHTYIFPADVPLQDQAHAVARGFPSASVNGQVYRYGMAGGGVTAIMVNIPGTPAAAATGFFSWV